jgi:hypothetical protein
MYRADFFRCGFHHFTPNSGRAVIAQSV